MNAMMMIFSLLIALYAGQAHAQVTCSAMGSSVYCSYPDGSSRTATELRPGQGVITGSGGQLEPYAVIPQPRRQAAPGYIQPLEPLLLLDPWQPPAAALTPGFSSGMPGFNPIAPMMMLGE